MFSSRRASKIEKPWQRRRRGWRNDLSDTNGVHRDGTLVETEMSSETRVTVFVMALVIILLGSGVILVWVSKSADAEKFNRRLDRSEAHVRELERVADVLKSNQNVLLKQLTDEGIKPNPIQVVTVPTTTPARSSSPARTTTTTSRAVTTREASTTTTTQPPTTTTRPAPSSTTTTTTCTIKIGVICA